MNHVISCMTDNAIVDMFGLRYNEAEELRIFCDYIVKDQNEQRISNRTRGTP